MGIRRKFRKRNLTFVVGNVYKFKYLPKTAALLNFYDTAPLIVFLDYVPSSQTIHGVNLHFMNLEYRRKFLQEIRTFRSLGHESNEINSMVMARLRWDYMMKRLARFGYVKIAIRQYSVRRILDAVEVKKNRAMMEILRNPKSAIRGYVTMNRIKHAIRMALKGKSWKEWSKVLPTKKSMGTVKR
jgi:hypothetical protein